MSEPGELKILAFDTATPATAVALTGPGGEVLEARDDPPARSRPGHASRLLPLVTELLERGQLGFDHLDRIAVGVGPGTFTGLRIGIATARGLAGAAGLPLAGVSTLHALALTAGGAARDAGAGAVAALIDARRGEVFLAAWAAGELGEAGVGPLIAPRVAQPEEAARVLGDLGETGLLAVGDGAIEFRALLERSGAQVPQDSSELHRVTAAAHLRIAARVPAGRPQDVQPQYLRRPDAREPAFLSALRRP